LSFPESLTTLRLRLRRYSAADAASVSRLVEDNRDHLLQNFMDMATGLRTPAQVEGFLAERSQLWDTRQHFCYGIWLTAAEQLIGQLHIKNIAWHIPSAELAYFIGAEHTRQGYASEVIRAALELTFETHGFERVSLRIIPANAPSLKLAEKLGFTPEGLHRKEFRCGRGELHDVHHFSLIREQYLKS
jgi:RimJ/RimL family protein N-acetyltransferase